NPVCYGTPIYDSGSGTYSASFASGCPHLQSYQWSAEMDYDRGGGAALLKDFAPDVNPAPPTPASRTGYWMLGGDGKLYDFGNAPHFGSAGNFAAAVTATRDGTGAWVVDFFGNVHWYGHATYQGGHPALRSGEFVTTISATPTAKGYW